MSEKGGTNALKIDQKILDKFWTLSEASASTSIKATDQLVQLLFQKQKHHIDDSSEELEYSVKRLVKGLASSRETARQGFAVALCQILRKFSTITVEEVLGLVSKHLKLPKKESKSETGYSYLGESLAYLALIQSGRLLKEDRHHVRKVTKSLLSISKKRSYLQQICTNAVCLIIQQVSSEDFQHHVWPEVEFKLQCGWDKCSPDVLSLLLTCRKHQSDLVNKHFLKENWDTKKLLKEENFPKLWKVLMEASICFPVIHNVNKLVVQELVRNECSLGQFWHTGQDLVFGTSNMRILNIGFHMLLELLPLVQSADEIKLILTPETVKIWVKNIDGNLRDVNPLLAVTKSIGAELIKIFKSCDNQELQKAILKCIVTTDIKPKNETLKTLDLLIQQLSVDAAKDYGKYLMESLVKLSSLEDGKLFGMLTTSDMVIHLRNLVTLSSTAADHDWQLELLKFLVLHSYWNVTGKSKVITHCSKKCENISDKLRKQLQDNFHKAITQLLVFKTESSKSTSVHAYKDTLHQLITYIQELLEDNTAVVIVKELSDKTKEDWNTVVKCLNEIHSKVDTDSSALHQSFELLFQYTAIQMFSEEEKDNSILEDLIACHKKATESKRKSVGKKTKEEPAWIEVLTELLLSMMSQGSLYARVVAKNVFAGLTNHITPESMSMIKEVLRLEKPGEDEPEVEEGEGEIEEDMELESYVDVDMENGESDSDEDTDSSETDGEVDDELRTAVKTALGPAAVKEGGNDEEEDDDSDLSDSEMFKLDDALAEVFRNMKKNKEKEKKEAQKQLNLFKLRVLDMVDALVKIQPPADLVLDLLFPLLELMEHGHKHKEYRELSNRAVHIFKLLYKKAKVHSNTTIGTDRYLEALKSVIEFSKKVVDRFLLLHISDACFLVIRLLFNMEISDLGPSPVKTRSMKGQENKSSKTEQEEDKLHKEAVSILDSSLQLCLGKRDNRLNPTFFINIFNKAPIVCWPLTNTLMNILKDKDTKVYCKTQACSMMAVMLNKSTHENLESSDWEEFSTELIKVLENIIRDTCQEEVKNKLLAEIFQVLSKLIPLCDNIKLADDVTEILNTQKQKFNTDCRRLYNTVTSRLQAHKSGNVNKEKRKSDTDTEQSTAGKKKK